MASLCVVEASAEVVGDFWILACRRQTARKAALVNKRRKLQQRQVVVGQDMQRVPQQFFGAGAKVIEVPA